MGLESFLLKFPLIIESDDIEPTKYYSLSTAVRGCGILKQTIVYAYRNRCMRVARRKGGSKVFRIEWWINFI